MDGHECEYKRRVDELEKRIIDLEKELAELKKQLEKPKKDSENSSISPSQDLHRRHYPKREKSQKKVGGQPGHWGSHRALSDTPDEVIPIYPQTCQFCRSPDLELLEDFAGRKQEITVLPQAPHIKEHRQHWARCRHCGKKSLKRDFYSQGPVKLGRELGGLIGLLKVSHHQSDQKIQRLLKDVYSLQISQGAVNKALNRLGETLTPEVEQIKDALKKEEVVGSDETGNRIKGKKGYVWIFQSRKYCLFVSHPSRGYRVIEETFGEEFPTVWVSDRYNAQLKTPCQHQLCLVHLIRECRYLIQAEKSQWAKSLKELFQEAIAFRQEAGENFDPLKTNTLRKIQVLKEKLDVQLDKPPPQELEKKLFNGLSTRKEQLFHFLDNPAVPSDNNGSERGVRSRVLHRKNTGTFQSPEGSQTHDKIASVLETAARHGKNLLDVLSGKIKLFPHLSTT